MADLPAPRATTRCRTRRARRGPCISRRPTIAPPSRRRWRAPCRPPACATSCCARFRRRSPNTACCTCRAPTSSRADASTRCTAGTATSSCWACCATIAGSRPTWSRTSSTRCATTAACSTRTARYYLTRSQPPLLSAMVLALFRAGGDQRVAARRARRDRRQLPALDGAAAPRPGGRAVALLRPRRGPGARGRRRRTRRARAQPLRSRARVFSRPRRPRRADAGSSTRPTASMRESGFDPTGRFGPFGADTLEHRARLPEHAALPHGAGPGRHRHRPRAATPTPRAGASWRPAAGARRGAAVGRRRRAVLRLRLRARRAAAPTRSRPRSGRCGRGWRRRRTRAACAISSRCSSAAAASSPARR